MNFSERKKRELDSSRMKKALIFLCLLIGTCILSNILKWDILVEKFFYDESQKWFFLSDWTLIELLYHYGTIPPIIFAVCCLFVLIFSYYNQNFVKHRMLMVFSIVALILGPGVLVNAVFKEYYGRPRPVQTTEFGGDMEYLYWGVPGKAHEGKSFPSGHASMGFYWLALYVYLSARKKRMAHVFFGLAVLHGALMGFGRMAQGKHFLTDVLWSAGMVYISSFVLSEVFLVLELRSRKSQKGNASRVLVANEKLSIAGEHE